MFGHNARRLRGIFGRVKPDRRSETTYDAGAATARHKWPLRESHLGSFESHHQRLQKRWLAVQEWWCSMLDLVRGLRRPVLLAQAEALRRSSSCRDFVRSLGTPRGQSRQRSRRPRARVKGPRVRASRPLYRRRKTGKSAPCVGCDERKSRKR